MKQIHNLQDMTTPASPEENDSQTLLNVPKISRPVSTIIPANNLASGIINRGEAVAIHFDGVGSGFRGGNTYTVRLDGSTGAALATITADQYAILPGTVSVPGSLPTGGHTIDITGTGQTDELIDVTQAVVRRTCPEQPPDSRPALAGESKSWPKTPTDT